MIEDSVVSNLDGIKMEGIEEILQNEESKNLEFKEKLTGENKQKVLQTIIAFANLGGGMLVFGVNDNKEVIGIEEPFELEEQIANMVYDTILPVIRIDTFFVSRENKTIVIVKVPMGIATPYYLKSKGIANGTYIRVGSTTRLADIETIRALELKKQNISYDSRPDYRFTRQDIDLEMAKGWFRDKKEIEITEDHLFMFKLLVKENDNVYPTVAGLLLFPTREFADYDYAKIKCAKFKGIESGIFIDKAEYRGSILEQIESTMKFIKANIKLSATIGEIYREEKYEYPLEALREAVINAVVHRDYMRTGRDIRVGIYDNRIEIISPGELPATFSVDDIGKIDFSELRNHILGRVFSELKLIEQWGLGFKKIIKLCEQHGIDRPEFIEETQNFKVIFYSNVTETSLKCHQMSPNVTNIGDIKAKQYAGVTKEERKEIIYQLIKGEVKFNISDLELIFDISLRTIKRDLAELKSEENIEYVGTPKNGYYRLKEKDV
jgi:predicted HTH transcriptional regulator